MLSNRQGTVVKILERRQGVTEVLVSVDGAIHKALNYDDLTGSISPGDRILLNVTAVQLGLGTGGYHFVMANYSNTGLDDRRPGHLMKLRYTPLQVKILAVEEEESPYRQELENCTSLDGMPVLVGSLHSMVPMAAAGLRAASGHDLRITYIMTDSACLPLAFSKLVPVLKSKHLIHGTITVGHAFGGDLEAVNIYTGLLAAKAVLKAHAAIVAMGPGIVGTATKWGFSGVEQGEIINAVNILGGRAVAIPRISFADKRERHYGISHHTLTALGRIALTPAILPLPQLAQCHDLDFLLAQMTAARLHEKHQIVIEEGDSALAYLQAKDIPVTTMGRTPEQDPAFFLAAGAAGKAAARLAINATIGV